MKKFYKSYLFGTLVVSSFVCVLAFQNCSRTNFNGDSSSFAVSESGTSDVALNEERGEDAVVSTEPVLKAESLVECELKSANMKITLNADFAIGSNAAETRVCMSENACLRLINEFALKHNCSLDADEPASQKNQQCTKIFPGSKGTCHNARLLADSEVQAIINAMK